MGRLPLGAHGWVTALAAATLAVGLLTWPDAQAQNPNIPTIQVATAPSGACSGSRVNYKTVTGLLYTCQSGTWAAMLGATGATGAVGATGPALATGNCSSSASPAVCTTAAAGSVVVAAAATTVVVNTTAVTANSQILVTFDGSLGTKLGVTCNATIPALYGVTARTAATSFTLTSTAPIANPACFGFAIIN
tara:strand:- start:1669 stop:2244 length:576 start_codon:yes stop_codon:yes gene_type:complete